ncbi:ATP-binding protein [Arabiibacter massiliensis]|uniref:ATP-binding protein n=1 Tax=Arabiibacter massiliensis TaxID=1870985 RepID=UPI001E28ECAB|nr:ATP-binding protein [Arabiibacter massiliensis]
MNNRVPRPYYQQLLERYRDTEFVKVLTGVRRCGKSTLLDLFIEDLRDQGVPESNVFRKRFDEFGLPLNPTAEDLQAEIAVELAASDSSHMFYVVLDEVQMVPEWERVVRGLQTRSGVDVYLTGSNAYLLSSDLATLLAGRSVEIPVYPLSFCEYAEFSSRLREKASGNADALFAEYLRYGGMPSLFALKEPREEDIARELAGIFNSVIVNDVAQRYQIRDYALLERLVAYVFSTSGNLFSVKSIMNYLKSAGMKASYETIDGYLHALEQALILHGAPQVGVQGKQLLRPLRKFYPVDTGLRNLPGGFSGRDVGFQLENVVYLELLRRGFKVSVGALERGEVDFVAQKRDMRRYIQVVDSLADPATYERELEPLRSLEDAFPRIVLTSDRLRVGTTEEGIRIVNVVDWLRDGAAE